MTSRAWAAGTPLTEQAEDIDRVWTLFLVIALVVGVGVIATIGWVVVRHRRRDSALPRQVRENIPVEFTYIVVPLLVVVGLFAVTFVSVRALDEVDEDPDLVVEAIGFQWQFQFRYPASGVTVTGTDEQLPELVLPASSTVRFDLTAVDVIHSFWIPGFRFKRDMFPGRTSSFSVDVGDHAGETAPGVCAEFCGLDHASMRFRVRIVTPDEFEQWLAAQPTNGGGA